MRKILVLLGLCFLMTGCSLIPHLTFNRDNTLPQSTSKSEKNERCQGDYKISPDGNIVTCSKGYYLSEHNFDQQERALTFKEKIINFFRGLAGWSFFIVVALLFICPSLAGWLVGRLFNVFRTGLSSTVDAISSFKDKARNSNDPDYKKAVDNLIQELSSAHQDAGVQKVIDKLRLENS